VMGSFYLTKFFEIKSVIVKAVQITELIIIVFMAFHFIQNGISKPYNTLLAILNYANLIFILGFITFLVIRGKSTVKKWLLTGIISQTILGVVGALILTGIINISWLNAYDTTLLGLFVEQGFFLFAAFTLLMNEKKEKIEVKKQNQILERTLVHNQEDLHDLQNRLTEFGKQASLMNIERIETNERLNNSALMNVLEEADEQFQASLLKLTPRLTVNEMRILQYMRIGLTNQEIAEANNISLDSLYVFRSRLKKKLSLEKNEKLEDFVLSIKSLKTTT
ncbi:MAG: LuxR C-terminal-related transcriptional regulator, partial [Flavobacteriales bacterium]|nr:LuxR C-terminal-related transcriptional regulator [Flavobacteriales bacterium]